MSSFPGGIDSFTSVSAGDVVAATLPDDQSSAIVAVETTLGTNPQGSYTTVGAAIAAQATQAAVQTEALVYAADTGSANAYAIALSPTPPTYTTGQFVVFKAANANTGASTLAVNGQAAKNLVLNGGSALTGGEIVTGQIVAAVYDGSAFQMLMVAANGSSPGIVNTINELRLTPASGYPVVGDFAAGSAFATSIYFTPYTGERIGLYNAGWAVYTTPEISINISALASGIYDVFVYLSGSTPTLEMGTIWTDNHDRAVALTLLDGVWVSSADSTRRYVGSCVVSAGYVFDWPYGRLVWNAQNRVPRSLATSGDTFNTNSSSWMSTCYVGFLVGLIAESLTGCGSALGQGDGVSTAAEIGLGFDYDGAPDGFNPVAGTIGTSFLAAGWNRVPDYIGMSNIVLYLRAYGGSSTINLLDDGAGTNLTSIAATVWA